MDKKYFQGHSRPYSEVIPSDADFTNDKFQWVLISHGFAIFPECRRLLVVVSPLITFEYNLSDEDVKKLTANSVTGKDGISLEERLNIINGVIGVDFSTKLTKDMLETKDMVNLELFSTAREEVETQIQCRTKEPHKSVPLEDCINALNSEDREQLDMATRDFVRILSAKWADHIINKED